MKPVWEEIMVGLNLLYAPYTSASSTLSVQKGFGGPIYP